MASPNSALYAVVLLVVTLVLLTVLARFRRLLGLHRIPLTLFVAAAGAWLAWLSENSHGSVDHGDANNNGSNGNGEGDDGAAWSDNHWGDATSMLFFFHAMNAASTIGPGVAYYVLLPPILFFASSHVNWQAFKRSLPMAAAMALPGALVGSLITAGLFKTLPYTDHWCGVYFITIIFFLFFFFFFFFFLHIASRRNNYAPLDLLAFRVINRTCRGCLFPSN